MLELVVLFSILLNTLTLAVQVSTVPTPWRRGPLAPQEPITAPAAAESRIYNDSTRFTRGNSL